MLNPKTALFFLIYVIYGDMSLEWTPKVRHEKR